MSPVGGDSTPRSLKGKQRNYFPPRKVTDFEWKDYCPDVFRRIRELQGIDQSNYMLTICSDEVLSKASSVRKVVRMFPLSNDDRFLVRFVQKQELKRIRGMLHNYYSHLGKNPATVIGYLYGLHSVTPVGGSKVYIAVQSKIIPAGKGICRVYDLKGSMEGRAVSKLSIEDKIILKDRDFNFCFYIDPLVRERFLEQIKRDTEFLEAEGVMDYSLLIGIAMQGSYAESINNKCVYSAIGSASFSSPSPSVSGYSSFPASVDGSERISSDTSEEFEELSFGDIWIDQNSPETKFGVELSARAVQRKRIGKGSESVHEGPGDLDSHDVVLYFGIVDIFQNYSVSKRLERAYKSLKYDSKSINAVNPKVYSSRFRDFLGQIFQAEDSNEQA